MQSFFKRLNENKGMKLLFCAITAVIIFFVGKLIFPTQNVEPEIVEAENVIIENFDGSSSVNDKGEKIENIVNENLDYTKTSETEILRVKTDKEAVITKEFVENNLRNEMIDIILTKKMLINVGSSQFEQSTMTETEIDGRKTFIETGKVKDKKYAIAYTKEKDNIVCTGLLYDTNIVESEAEKIMKTASSATSLYIQQARKEGNINN